MSKGLVAVADGLFIKINPVIFPVFLMITLVHKLLIWLLPQK